MCLGNMRDAAIEQALRAGVAHNDEGVALARLAHTDWALRRLRKRRMQRALNEAALAVAHAQDAAPSTAPRDPALYEAAHLMKLAALQLRGQQVHPLDTAGTLAQFAQLPPIAPTRWPVATVALGLAGAGAFALLLMSLRPAQSSSELGAAKVVADRPPVAAAFAQGGLPGTDARLETLLRDELAALVIETDRVAAGNAAGEAQRRIRLQALRSAPWFAQRGGAVARAWDSFLRTLDAAAVWPLPEAQGRVLAEQVQTAARELSDEFAALGVGYYLDTQSYRSNGQTHTMVYSYRVTEVTLVHIDGKPQRVLNLRRLDKLNLQRSVLGMESEALGAAVVLLDQMEEHVLEHIVPALTEDGAYQLGDETWRDNDATASVVERLAGRLVRAEWLAALGEDATAMQHVASLLAQRQTLLRGYASRLQQRGLRLNVPAGQWLPEGYLESLDDALTADEVRAVQRIEDELRQRQADRVLARVHALLRQSVQVHEAQHAADAKTPQRYPAAVEQWVGPAQLDGEVNRLGRRVNAELSAYMSQLANNLQTPQTNLWQLAQHALNDRAWGTAESYVAVIVIASLVEELGLPEQPLVDGRRIARENVVHQLLAIGGKSSEELRGAAARAWRRSYDRALPVALVK